MSYDYIRNYYTSSTRSPESEGDLELPQVDGTSLPTTSYDYIQAYASSAGSPESESGPELSQMNETFLPATSYDYIQGYASSTAASPESDSGHSQDTALSSHISEGNLPEPFLMDGASESLPAVSYDYTRIYYAPSTGNLESETGFSQDISLPSYFFESCPEPFQMNDTSLPTISYDVSSTSSPEIGVGYSQDTAFPPHFFERSPEPFQMSDSSISTIMTSDDDPQTYCTSSRSTPQSATVNSQDTAFKFPPHLSEIYSQEPFQMHDISPPVARIQAPAPMGDDIEMLDSDTSTGRSLALEKACERKTAFDEVVDQLQLNADLAGILKPAEARAKIFKSLSKISSLHIPADCACVQIYPGFDHELEYRDGELSIKIDRSSLDGKNDEGYSTYTRQDADMIAHCLPTDKQVASLGDRRRGKLPIVKPYTDNAPRDFVLLHHASHRFWVSQALLYGLKAHGNTHDIQQEFVEVFKRNFGEQHKHRVRLEYTLDVDDEIMNIEKGLQLYLDLYRHAYTHYTGKKHRRKEPVITVRWDGIPIDKMLAKERSLGPRPKSSIRPKGKALNRKRVFGKDKKASLYVSTDHPDATIFDPASFVY